MKILIIFLRYFGWFYSLNYGRCFTEQVLVKHIKLTSVVAVTACDIHHALNYYFSE
jgi:hypothetical protein